MVLNLFESLLFKTLHLILLSNKNRMYLSKMYNVKNLIKILQQCCKLGPLCYKTDQRHENGMFSRFLTSTADRQYCKRWYIEGACFKSISNNLYFTLLIIKLLVDNEKQTD